LAAQHNLSILSIKKIQDIINRAPAPVAHLLAQPQMDLPQEDVVVHRIVGTTHILDIISLLTVLVLGLYVLVWKNPGFWDTRQLCRSIFSGASV